MAVDTKYTTVESGWQRIDCADSHINYDSSFTLGSSNIYYSDILGAKIIFYVYSSNIRILDNKTSTNRSNNINVIIDNSLSEYYSGRGTTTGNEYTCVYERLSLEKSIHKIEITNGSTNSLTRIGLQCLDIDEDGRMCTQEEYELQEAKNKLFPVRVADDTVTTEENVANYTATLTNGERQLLLLNNGEMYLSDGKGSHIQMGGSGSYSEIDSLPTFTNPNK